MRLSTIAVCLLLVSPSPVLACWKDAPEQTGWFQEIPSSYGDSAMGGARETMPGWSLAGAGLASIALVMVSFRAFTRAAGRAPMPMTGFARGEDGDRRSRSSRIADQEFNYA
jgi:hypothetical protein